MEQISRYLEILRLRVAPATYDLHRQYLRRFGRWLTDNEYCLPDIGKETLVRYLQSLNHTDPKYFNDTLRTIRKLYDWLCVEPNPTNGVPNKMRKPRRLPKIPGEQHLQKVIDNIKGSTEEITLRNQLICELAWGSGLRRAEIVGLDIDDIDMSEQTALVTGKGSKQRVVPLTAASVKLIREYLTVRGGFNGPLILSTRGVNRRPDLRHVSKIVRENTGLNTHRFRHACATHMLQNGCDLRSPQKLLGHTELTMTAWYAQTSKTGVAKILNQTHPRAKNL
jgi:integrase/recombinase XerC